MPSLSANIATIPPGGVAYAHIHVGFEVILYIIEGKVRHEFGDGRARYEPAGHGHHDHLINMKTGEVIEFSNEQIERLQESVARELGFRLVGHRLELFGMPLKNGK